MEKRYPVFEFKLYRNLPKELKDKIINASGEDVPSGTVDPNALICVRISENPGIVPILAEGLGLSKIFFNLVDEVKFPLNEFIERLKAI